MSDLVRLSTRQRPRLLAGLLGGLALPGLGRLDAGAENRPDIVVMVMNDARAGDEEALPQTMAHLAANGTTFPNFLFTTPLCCPSRASIFTGLYPHSHGVYDNRSGPHGGWEGFAANGNRERTTGALLRGAGYRTAAIGTYLNGPQPAPGEEPGWDVGPHAVAEPGDEAHIVVVDAGVEDNGDDAGASDGQSEEMGSGSDDSRKKNRDNERKEKQKREKTKGIGYDDLGTGAVAASIIAETPDSEPLYLHIGFGAPHVPADPGAKYAGSFADARVSRDPSFNEADTSDKPAYISEIPALSDSDEAWLDDLQQKRLEVMLALDDAIALVWDALEARGRLDNTYVFLMSDNGNLLGQHRFYGKIAPYDVSARMPLYAYGPNFGAGVVDMRIVGNIDIAPTLLEISGVDGPEMDGRSLLSPFSRDAVLLEVLGEDLHSMNWPGPRTDIPRYSGVRTADHLYVEYVTGERELYDYNTDPYETENLLAGPSTPEVEAIASELAARLDALRGCSGDKCA
jgi:arylsulfatase A-like enzyme